jgi:glycosyltransferase involved in cell wall biosynthesis
MTRVLQAMAGAVHGGAEAFFVRMVKSLHESGLNQHVVIRPGDGREVDLSNFGLNVDQAPFRTLFDFQTGPTLRRVIDDFRPDICLSWMSRAAQLMPPMGTGQVHVARLGGFYHLKYFTRCDHLIGNTRYLTQWLIAQGWPADRVHYLPNFTDAKPASALDRASLDTPDDAKVILALGRFHDDKAFDVLIPALTQIPQAILWLGGEGEREVKLRRQAENAGVAARIRWLGWRKDVAALSAAADVLACPSRVEPLGNVVLEAWGHGLPVVAAASSGPKELIKDGLTGLLVPIEDADALARALGRVLSNPGLADELRANAQVQLAQEFSKASVTAAFLDFFERVKR